MGRTFAKVLPTPLSATTAERCAHPHGVTFSQGENIRQRSRSEGRKPLYKKGRRQPQCLWGRVLCHTGRRGRRPLQPRMLFAALFVGRALCHTGRRMSSATPSTPICRFTAIAGAGRVCDQFPVRIKTCFCFVAASPVAYVATLPSLGRDYCDPFL